MVRGPPRTRNSERKLLFAVQFLPVHCGVSSSLCVFVCVCVCVKNDRDSQGSKPH